MVDMIQFTILLEDWPSVKERLEFTRKEKAATTSYILLASPRPTTVTDKIGLPRPIL